MRISHAASGHSLFLGVIALAAVSIPSRAANDYPVRPIRIVAGSAAGVVRLAGIRIE